MATNELFKQINDLVEREALAFCKQTARRYDWQLAGTYLRCRSGHLFGVCMALKALQSTNMVTEQEWRDVRRELLADIRNSFRGDAVVANKWMQIATSDAARGTFRTDLIAWNVEQILCPRPVQQRTPLNSKPQTPALRVIEGGKQERKAS